MSLFTAVRDALVQRRAKAENQYVQKQKGFTLFEILLVMGILGGLIALLVGNLGGMSASAQKKNSILKASTIQSALIRYQTDMGSFPTTEQGLGVLLNSPGSARWSGPYVANEDDLKTPWNTDYSYKLTPKGPELTAPPQGDGPAMVFVNGKLIDAPQEGAPGAQ